MTKRLFSAPSLRWECVFPAASLHRRIYRKFRSSLLQPALRSLHHPTKLSFFGFSRDFPSLDSAVSRSSVYWFGFLPPPPPKTRQLRNAAICSGPAQGLDKKRFSGAITAELPGAVPALPPSRLRHCRCHPALDRPWSSLRCPDPKSSVHRLQTGAV